MVLVLAAKPYNLIHMRVSLSAQPCTYSLVPLLHLRVQLYKKSTSKLISKEVEKFTRGAFLRAGTTKMDLTQHRQEVLRSYLFHALEEVCLLRARSGTVYAFDHTHETYRGHKL